MEITTIGLDLAKNFFQVHGVDDAGAAVLRRTLRRSQVIPFFTKLQPCLVGMEACGTSHYWAREITRLGHDVKLMPPRGKTDANDAEAICEAVTRPTMRFVAVKSPEQQAALSIHRARDLMVKQRTQMINMIRGLSSEFGLEAPRGLHQALTLARRLIDGEPMPMPALAVDVVASLSRQLLDCHEKVLNFERAIVRWHRGNDISRRLATIPGIGPIGASAFTASVTDPHQFKSGRQFAAWLGLTPLQNSSGGKERLGRISKMGDRYLRKLLIVGMTALVRNAKYKPEKTDPRLAHFMARKPTRVATVALANKTARIVWAIMTRGDVYRRQHIPVLAA